MMAERSACEFGGTFEHNTSFSAETWRTRTRLKSIPACSASPPNGSVKRVTKEEAKRDKSNHSVKMMLESEA